MPVTRGREVVIIPQAARPGGAAISTLRLAGLVLLVAGLTACTPSLYGWTVRTSSTPPAGSFQPSMLETEPVAIFEALAPGGLRGTELGLSYHLADILGAVAPTFKVVSPRDTASRINTRGLTPDYVRMRTDYEQSNILEATALRKLGAAVEARYVFQPRLGTFTQTMTVRWSPWDLRIVQTRSSILRLSLQLWDTRTGEPVWSSIAEASLSSEVVLQDPVYLEDAVRITLGGVVADFLRGQTSSTYTPLNKAIDSLIRAPQSGEKRD
jgi:hypothetical protein